jgi:hypothetical protein
MTSTRLLIKILVGLIKAIRWAPVPNPGPIRGPPISIKMYNLFMGPLN